MDNLGQNKIVDLSKTASFSFKMGQDWLTCFLQSTRLFLQVRGNLLRGNLFRVALVLWGRGRVQHWHTSTVLDSPSCVVWPWLSAHWPWLELWPPHCYTRLVPLTSPPHPGALLSEQDHPPTDARCPQSCLTRLVKRGEGLYSLPC